MHEKKTSKAQTCPRCGSEDTFWNDSQADPDDDSACFIMMCDGCHLEYTAIFRPTEVYWEEE